MALPNDPRRTTTNARSMPGFPGSFKGQLPNESVTRPRFNINPVPTQGQQPSQGAWAASRYALAVQVGEYGSGFTVNQFEGYWSAYVSSPSARLRVSILVLAESATRDVSFAWRGQLMVPGPTGFGIWAGSVNPITGKQVVMQQVFGVGPVVIATNSAGTAPRPVSDGYEADSAASLYFVQGTMGTNDWSAAAGVLTTDNIKLSVVCTWEPNCEISPEELKLLFAACNVRRGAANINEGLGLPGPWPQILNVPI
jgi:hypothetical protein